jgi:dihydroxyacetone kinase-like protein
MGDSAALVQALRAICQEIRANKDRLCALDAALGDGDHGISMAKAFGAVEAQLASASSEDVGLILHDVGMTLLSAVGGAMGPIFGTAFLRAGKVATGHTVVAPELIAEMLDAAENGVVARGKAKPGDKTMLDALHPAAQAARAVADAGGDVATTVRAAAEAAEAGARATRDMVARMGRASRLGERSLGHQDPGATSLALILGVASRCRGTASDSERESESSRQTV